MKPRDLGAAIVKAKAPVSGLARGLQPVGITYGVVQSIQAGPPVSLTITLAGSSTSIAGVRFLAGYQPAANDTVVVLQAGHDLIVQSKLAVDLHISSKTGATAPSLSGISGLLVNVSLLAGATDNQGIVQATASASGGPANNAQEFIVNFGVAFSKTPTAFVTPIGVGALSWTVSTTQLAVNNAQGSPYGANYGPFQIAYLVFD